MILITGHFSFPEHPCAFWFHRCKAVHPRWAHVSIMVQSRHSVGGRDLIITHLPQDAAEDAAKGEEPLFVRIRWRRVTGPPAHHVHRGVKITAGTLRWLKSRPMITVRHELLELAIMFRRGFRDGYSQSLGSVRSRITVQVVLRLKLSADSKLRVKVG